MPQKKNLDPIELVRAKSAKVTANFQTAITILHGLTSGYNLDYQEVTPLLWQSIDELKACLGILTALMPRIKLAEGIADRTALQFTAATEIANLLVRMEKMPFRTAHQKVGLLVKSAIVQGRSLDEMGPSEWERALRLRMKPKTLKGILDTLDMNRHISLYRSAGSPNPVETRRLIAKAQMRCNELARELRRKTEAVEGSRRLLRKTVAST
jgi:argininosuccinate lyase